ncbi:hypothetical protein [Cellulosimicrobium cellulans]|uniref:hypothetical protein n=1 Tax=Cellulosimicrobium cellulans TaxID=1710 RepID=UPI0020CF6724|nr:hypothetical protein NMQ07_19285 [Cellulosimicrobium cellulans]
MATYEYMTLHTTAMEEGWGRRVVAAYGVTTREWIGLKFEWANASRRLDGSAVVLRELASRAKSSESDAIDLRDCVASPPILKHGRMGWLSSGLFSYLINGETTVSNDLYAAWGLVVVRDQEGRNRLLFDQGFPVRDTPCLLNGVGARGWRLVPEREEVLNPVRDPTETEVRRSLFERSSDDLPDDKLLDDLGLARP